MERNETFRRVWRSLLWITVYYRHDFSLVKVNLAFPYKTIWKMIWQRIRSNKHQKMGLILPAGSLSGWPITPWLNGYVSLYELMAKNMSWFLLDNKKTKRIPIWRWWRIFARYFQPGVWRTIQRVASFIFSSWVLMGRGQTFFLVAYKNNFNT